MKEELKTEDIVGYLPYRLEMQHKFEKAKHGNEKKLRPWITELKPLFLPKTDYAFDWFPLLIPLHSLTKDQLVHFSICFRLWYDKPNFDYKQMIYQDIETCHKLHVDYRGLIEKVLAIKK